MKRIALGVCIAIGVFVLTGLSLFLFADLPGEAEANRLEAAIASDLLTAKLRLMAKPAQSPIQGNSTDIDRGREIYQEQCSYCHGDRGREAVFARSFSPRPPQFANTRLSRPTWMNAHLIRHGIRWTAMPAFRNLPEADAWRVAAYVETLNRRSVGR